MSDRTISPRMLKEHFDGLRLRKTILREGDDPISIESQGNPGSKTTKTNSLIFMKVLQRCGNVMCTSQLLLHQDIEFATSPVHHFVPKSGCLAGLVLRPRSNDPLLEAIVEPVD